MPLRAVIDGEDKVAPLLDDAEWEALKLAVSRKEKTILMPCCNAAGRLRVSKLGTKHFYHNKMAECDWKPESVEHLRAKTEILLACKKAGYSVLPEKIGTDWCADVYAEKGNAKIAFEVQWSKQNLEETQERQAKYRRDGIRGCWFFRKPPFEYDYLFKADNELPLFKVSGGQLPDESFYVEAPDLHSPHSASLALPEFVALLLERKIRYRSLMSPCTIQQIKVFFVREECYRCKKISHIYYVDASYESRCGKEMQYRPSRFANSKSEDFYYEFRPEIMSAVENYLKSNPYDHLRLGAVKMRYSAPENCAYVSFGCYYCDALFGNFYLYHNVHATIPEAQLYGNSDAFFEAEVVVKDMFSETQQHWCYPADGNFCEAAINN